MNEIINKAIVEPMAINRCFNAYLRVFSYDLRTAVKNFSSNRSTNLLTGLNFFLASFSFCFLTLINTAACTGLIIIATNKDEDKQTISVIGRYLINSPTIPRKNNIGKNDEIIVSVATVTGNATSRGPSNAASCGVKFSFSCRRYIFSITTIASSTIIPRTSISVNKTTTLSVTPIALSIMNDIKNDNGIEVAVSDAILNPRNKNNTATTSTIPVITPFSS